MSLTTILDYTRDTAEPVLCTPVRTAFIAGDAQAHRLSLRLTHAGTAVLPEGMLVTVCMIRADDTSVVFSGFVEGECLCAILPAACYAIPGRFSLFLRGTQEDVSSTLLWLEGSVTAAETDAIVSPDATVPTLTDLISRLDSIKEAETSARSAAAAAMTAAASATHCYVQPSAPENPVRGDLWVNSPDMESWATLGAAPWQQASSSAWLDMLTAEDPVMHVYDGFAWRTLCAVLA